MTRLLSPTNVAKMPWVTRYVKPKKCQGFKANTPLKAAYWMGKNPPVGLDKYGCKNPAYWHFTPLRSGPRFFRARAGDYCWSHLIYRGLLGSDLESERTQDFLTGLSKRTTDKED